MTQPIEETTPYGYKVFGSRLPYVPETGREPLQASPQDGTVEDFRSVDDFQGQLVGPALYRAVLEQADTPEGRRMLAALLGVDEREPRSFVYEGVVGLETDGSGNAYAKLFDVPNGARAYLTRAILEVGGQAPNSAVVANAWAGVYETSGGTTQVGNLTTATYQPGQLRDFAPKSSSSGLFLPADLVSVNKDNAWGYRSGSSVVVVIAGAAGIATKGGTVAYKFVVEFDQSVTAT